MCIRHLNCGTCCPAGGRLFDGRSDAALGRLVCQFLPIGTDRGFVLVGPVSAPRTSHVRANGYRPSSARSTIHTCAPTETAVEQVRRLGFSPDDVRHIVVTHLDFDHAGGIEDFPNAAVHLTAREEVADRREGGAFVGTRRYRPGQWDEVHDWRLYPFGGGERWFGFDAVRDLNGIPPEILLVPRLGHSWGHAGVAVREDDGRWLFDAFDVYFDHGEIGSEDYAGPPGLRGYQPLMKVDRAARMENPARFRLPSIDQGGAVRMLCAHDVTAFEMLAGAAPAG